MVKENYVAVFGVAVVISFVFTAIFRGLVEANVSDVILMVMFGIPAIPTAIAGFMRAENQFPKSILAIPVVWAGCLLGAGFLDSLFPPYTYVKPQEFIMGLAVYRPLILSTPFIVGFALGLVWYKVACKAFRHIWSRGITSVA